MPVNRNALIRYKTIDLCLQNRYRKWTLDDLVEACSESLYEYEGIRKGVSQRTVQLDIQLMRSDKLGYNAPIVVREKKYYAYDDQGYSIMNIPVSENDLNKLMETVDFLKQFKGFSYFRELDTVVQKLEDHVYSKKINRKPVIDFEKNDNLKGLEFLETLYQSIIHKNIIELTYQSFTARQAQTFPFYPYLLKEFRNRWFLIGSKNNAHPLYNLAIDRIIAIKRTEKTFTEMEEFDSATYFKNVIGVTVSQNLQPEKVTLFVNRRHAPYVLTKPFHPSQKLISSDEEGIAISLEVQHNFELEKEILGLGDGVVVISPERLKRAIFNRLNHSVDQYQTILTEKDLNSAMHTFLVKGFISIHKMLTQRDIDQLNLFISKIQDPIDQTNDWQIVDLIDNKELKAILLNRQIRKVLTQVTKSFQLYSIKFYKRIPDSLFGLQQSVVTHQIMVIILLRSLTTTPFLLQIVPGSHKKILSTNEIDAIAGNCKPIDCPVNKGGAILLHPAVLRCFPEILKNEKVGFIMMEFALNG